MTAGERVRVTIQLIAYDEKRLHFYQEAHHAAEGWVAATCENLSLHVDMTTRKVTPFPDDILGNLAVMKAAHARLKPPKRWGTSWAFRRRRYSCGEPMRLARGIDPTPQHPTDPGGQPAGLRPDPSSAGIAGCAGFRRGAD